MNDPVGSWADVVTNHTLDLKLESLEHRLMSRVDQRFVEMQRHFMLTVILAMMGSKLSVGGLAFAAAKLF